MWGLLGAHTILCVANNSLAASLWLHLPMDIFKHIVVGIFFLSLITGVFGMEGCRSNPGASLPDEIGGWKVAGEDRVYDRDTLYEYIDGGAELYLSYGFERVVSRTYVRSDQPDILVDVFDMGRSWDAFGVFSHGMEMVDETLGQGSQYTAGMMLFWKDRFFLSILAYPETAESKEAVFDLSRAVEAAIPEAGSLPEIMAFLPEGGLVRESVRYFRHHAWLNTYCFIADQNVLHLGDEVDAVLAKYGEESRSVLLLLSYRAEQDARRAYEDFVAYYQPDLSEKRAVQVEDGTWTAGEQIGVFVAVALRASSEDRVLRLMQAVRNELGRTN